MAKRSLQKGRDGISAPWFAPEPTKCGTQSMASLGTHTLTVQGWLALRFLATVGADLKYYFNSDVGNVFGYLDADGIAIDDDVKTITFVNDGDTTITLTWQGM